MITEAVQERENYLNASYGIKSWLLTKDHKRIALLYLHTITFFFFLGGIFATLIRLELLTPKGDLVSADTYSKLFTLHGVIMVFFFLIPSIPATLGNFFLPMMIGAKDLAFPRINLLSWYLLVIGGCFAMYAMLAGGVDTGWTFYVPYSTNYSNTYVIATGLGIFIAGFSSILTGLNFIVTVHRMRAPGMTWFRLPLFVWSNYATALIQVLGTPVIAITLVLLICERALHIGIFDPARGGDPVLFQHLFWFYSHPAVYIMVLPAMGVISELVSVFSRKPVFGYKFVAFSSVAIAVLGFLVWGHHMFVSGQSVYAGLVFSFLSYFVAIPSAIKVFNWTATLHKGSISYATPMLYAFGFIGLFTVGGLTGLVRGVPRRGCPRSRHLLRDCPFPLHHGGRHHHGLSRRPALLVAQDVRPHVSGRLGEALGPGHLSGLQSDILPAIHSGLSGHAAALLELSGRVPGVACDVHRGRVRAGGRISDAADLLHVVAAVWTDRRARIPGAPPAWNGRRLRRRPLTISTKRPIVTTEAYDYAAALEEAKVG